MLEYTEVATLYDGHRTRVVRGRRANGDTLIVKQLKSAYPSPGELARLQREHDLLGQLDGEGSCRALGYDEREARLLLEDVRAVALSELIASRALSADEALRIARNTARGLASVHARGILHRDVNPSNLIVDPDALTVWLIDFDLASPVPQRRARPQPIHALEGTPAYASPEQTGRMNRAVDARSDLYSLGVTLYELFCGKLPFERADLVGLAHAHLAQAAPRLEPRMRGLPEAAVQLVATLLRKRPEERYQSAAGLAADLDALLDELRGGQAAVLSGRAVTDRLELPQELHGREGGVAALIDDLEAVCAGGCRMALVTGEAGIGKTSLVHELYKPATLAGARLVEGKFDQFARETAYTAIAQVLARLAAEVLGGTTSALASVRATLVDATRPNTALLVELAPALGVLTGPQPPVQEVPPAEAARRLQETVRRALGALAGKAHPLVLFLDDLQWADLPSLRLIESLFRDPDLSHLMLVASWRNEEVGAEHAVRPTVQSLRDSGVPVRDIALGPLRPADVARLLSAALGRPEGELAELVGALHAKTGGNPFFLHRVVEQAWVSGAIRFDREAVAWAWDAYGIAELAPADNVISLLQAELRTQSDDVRACLSAAALLADSFDADAVGLATELPAERIREALAAAVAGRFVSPIDEDWWSGAAGTARPFRFAFVHDRVQQAARELLPEGEMATVHLRMARGLHASPQRVAHPFEVAEHYCAAIELVDTPEERGVLAEVATAAGERALRSAAFAPAQAFLEAALTARGDGLWEADRDAAWHLVGLAARAGWLAGDQAALERHVRVLRERATTVLERLVAEEVMVSATAARGELGAALDQALAVLAQAGTAIPRHPTSEDVMAAVGRAMGALAARDLDEVLATACAEDDALELAQRRLLIHITAAAYLSEPNLLPLIACNLVERTLSRGASKESAYGFAVFALTLCAGWELAAGTAMGRVALQLLDAHPDRLIRGMTRHVVDNFSRVWSEPLASIVADNAEVVRMLLDAGDLELAGWSMHQRALYALWAGEPLARFSDQVDGAMASMRLHDHQAAWVCTQPIRRLVDNLLGRSEDPSRLDGPGYDVDAAFSELLAANFRAAGLTVSICRLTTRLYFGDLPGAAAMVDHVVALQDGAVAIWYQVTWRAYAALVLLDQTDDVEATLARVSPWRAALVAVAAHNHANGAHLLALFDAEVARAKGELLDAITHWDRAITLAGEAGFPQDEALINERAGRFHLRRGARRIARAYLLDARFAWQRWGAVAKVEQLDAEFGSLLAPVLRASEPDAVTRTTGSGSSGRLDFQSVLKAGVAIAQETDLDRLLSRGLEILLENVGARRGALLLLRRGELVVEAVVRVGEPVQLTRATPLGERDDLLEAVIRRVHRSGAAEVHDHIAASGTGALSVLCTPIAHQGRALGVLYFENDFSAGAFTPERLSVLDVLAPQLAVAVRNARLQAAQERFVPRQFLASLDREDIVDVQVGDHQLKEVTIFFSDVWGFTPLVETLSAAEALELVNRYLSYAEPAITGSRGFIDTYLGDGIMALFDEPEANAQHAVHAAIAVHRALDRFNEERRTRGLSEIRTGIGLNTGVVTMATIGGVRSLKCGVVGDAVNVASRVEGLTRRCVARLLLSGNTRERLLDTAGLHLRTAGRVRVRGRNTPLTLYEVLAAELPDVRAARVATLDTYEEAVADYFGGDPGRAARGFAECLRHTPGDPQPLRFLESARQLLRDGVPSDWNGIETLTAKR